MAFNIGGVRNWLLNEVNIEAIIRIVIDFLKKLLVGLYNFLYDFLKVIANAVQKILIEELQKLFEDLRNRVFEKTGEDVKDAIPEIPQQ